MTNFRASLFLVLGLASAVGLAELGLRAVGDGLPESSDWPTAEAHMKSQQLEDLRGDVQVLFIGSSATEAGVDPELIERATGLSTYNSAMPFMTPAAYEVWLSEVALEHIQPSLVLIGLPVWTFEGTGDPLAEGLRTAVDGDLLDDLSTSSSLLARRGVFADWDRLAARRDLLEEAHITEFGHQTGYYDKVSGEFDGLDWVGSDTRLSSHQLAALKTVVEIAVTSGAHPVIVIEPSRRPGDGLSSRVLGYTRWLRALASEWGVEIWDAYSIDWEPTLFADDVHFNRAGTTAYSRYLADQIKALQGD